MRLKSDEIHRLSTAITTALFDDKSITMKAERRKIQLAIDGELQRHFEEEREIESRAEELVKANEASLELSDRGKALARVRRQLAEQKSFILSGGDDSRFSEDKLYHLAHLVADKVYDDDLLDFPDEDDGPKFMKKFLLAYFHCEDEAARRARDKIRSLSKAPYEGSRDWDILYRKYFEEEMKRMGH